MSNIRVNSSVPVFDGQPLTFKSPADCSQVSGIIVYYPDGDATASKVFQFADAHGNNVGDLDLFAADAVVKVVLDIDKSMAFVQNADTNAYLEEQFATKATAPQQASGEVIAVADSAHAPLQGLKIYGKTTQNGTPTPEAPIPLVSAGENGSICVTVAGKNLFGGDALADKLVEIINGAIKDTDAGTVKYHCQNARSSVWFDNLKPNTQYTIILYGKNDNATSKETNMMVKYTDGTHKEGISFCTQGENSYCVCTTASGKSVSYIGGVYRSGATILHYDKCGVFEGVLTETDFEPYKGQTAAFSTPNGLHGIDSIKDEIDFARGVRVQRVGTKVFDGTEGWVIQTSGDTHTSFWTDISKNGLAKNAVFSLCSHAPFRQSAGEAKANGHYIHSNFVMLSVPNEIASTSAQMKAYSLAQFEAGTPISIAYQLATHNEPYLSAEELAQYSALHTNKPNTTVFNDGGADMEIRYCTPNAAVPMNVGSGASGKVLSVDEHGCVVPKELDARPNTWMPTAEEVGARPSTWTPTAEEAGARPNTWMPTATDVGAIPKTGGDINGYLDFRDTSMGLTWKTADGTFINLRPYSPANVFQLTMRNPTNGTEEFGVVNIHTDGTLSFARPDDVRYAIGAAPAGYGWGETDVWPYTPHGDPDNVDKSCYFVVSQGNIPADGIWIGQYIAAAINGDMTVRAVTGPVGSICKRIKLEGVWQPWEWENPPMVIGVEYRTTERHNGKSVFVKAVELNLAGSGFKSVYVAAGIAEVVSMEGSYYQGWGGVLSEKTVNPSTVQINVSSGTLQINSTDMDGTTAKYIVKYTYPQ